MKRGGKRKGSGRPAGTVGIKHKNTIAKEQAREIVRGLITAKLKPLVDAQIDNAQGIRHLMMRDPKTGKFERVAADSSDPKVAEAQIDAALKSGNAVWMYTKDPSVQAFTDLLNRAIDKPADQLQLTGANGGPIVITAEKARQVVGAKRRLAKMDED